MPYIVCVEERDGSWVAHVPDLPGCYAAHHQRERAVQAIPLAVDRYIEWCQAAGMHISGLTGPMMVAEVIRAWEFEDGQMVHAFFASDRPSVLEDEIPEYRSLLIASNTDLLLTMNDLDAVDIHRPMGSSALSISEGLLRLGDYEQWHLDKFGFAADPEELPEEPTRRLEAIRQHHINVLPDLAARRGVVTIAGETWSVRKVLRVTLWQERELTAQFRQLGRRTA